MLTKIFKVQNQHILGRCSEENLFLYIFGSRLVTIQCIHNLIINFDAFSTIMFGWVTAFINFVSSEDS